jgi:hypothetical protein
MIFNHFVNGVARRTEYRCKYCSCVWSVNSSLQCTMVKRGWTPAERAAAIREFAVMQHQVIELHKANAPEEYFRYVQRAHSVSE